MQINKGELHEVCDIYDDDYTWCPRYGIEEKELDLRGFIVSFA